MEFINHLGYNSVVILTFFFISLIALILNYITKGKSNNFLYILLIGPMIEEKYGSKNLTIMILVTAIITGIINMIFTNKKILGASGIVFMLIVLSSFVNITTGKVPITLILICIFYVINEIISGIFKKDDISHTGHLIGALCGFIFGFYVFK